MISEAQISQIRKMRCAGLLRLLNHLETHKTFIQDEVRRRPLEICFMDQEASIHLRPSTDDDLNFRCVFSSIGDYWVLVREIDFELNSRRPYRTPAPSIGPFR